MLYNDDCFNIFPQIKDKSIDMVLCDLPYGVLNKSNPSAKWDSTLPLTPLWEQYRRIIKDKGTIVLFGQGMFTANVMLSAKDIWRYNLIWEKDRPTGFLDSKKKPMRSHEDIMVFYKSIGTYNPQMTPCTPDQRNHPIGNGKHKDRNQLYGKFDRAINPVISDFKYPRSIIKIKSEHKCDGNNHPTQKPVALCEWLINTYTNPNDVVLDNCMGSGSTGVAAINLNRQFIGIEKDAEYFKLASDRIDKAKSITRLEDYR